VGVNLSKKNHVLTEEERVNWLQSSADILKTIFLVDNDGEKEMGIVSDLIEVSDDTFVFYASTDFESDRAIEYIVKVTEATRSHEEDDAVAEAEAKQSNIISNPNTGIITDPNVGKIIGINGEVLS